MDISRNISIQDSTMTSCHYCGSPIMSGDEICKHCFEYQRINEQENVNLKDPSLSIYDWIIVFFSQLLGMFIALIHFIKGEKSRGIKLFKCSLILLFCKVIASYPVYYIFKTFYKILKGDL